MDLDLALLAGTLSSVVFVSSMLPMVVKAIRTRDLDSYSLGNLLLANLGNVVHSFYVFSLPMGPIWALHSFYVVTSAIMLSMYVRHAHPDRERPHETRAKPGRISGDDNAGAGQIQNSPGTGPSHGHGLARQGMVGQSSMKGSPQAHPSGFWSQSSATFLDSERQMSASAGALGTLAVPGMAIHGPPLTENWPRYAVVTFTGNAPVS